LASRKRAVAAVRVTVKDTAGNKRSLTREIRIKR
jgi:hypothetical protein